MDSGSLDLPFIAAGTTSQVALPKRIFDFRHPPETWLTVLFRQTNDTAWAKAGHVIAWSQARLYHEKPHKATSLLVRQPRSSTVHSTFSDSLILTETPIEYRVSTPNSVIAWDRFRGHIVLWNFNGAPLLHNSAPSSSDTRPLITLDFWRPPTNNDAVWQTGEWKRYGLDMMTSRLVSFSFIGASIHTQQSDDGTSQTLRGLSFQAVHEFAPPILSWSFSARIKYTVFIGWDRHVPFKLLIHTELMPKGNHPPNLPRVGYNVQMAPAYDTVSWFGLGPGESYNDKCSSQQVGIWEKNVRDMGTNYEVPQENGNRVGTRWCTLRASKDAGDDTEAQARDQPQRQSKQHASYAEREHPKTQADNSPTPPILRASFPPSDSSSSPSASSSSCASPNTHFQFSTQLYDASTIEKAAHPCDLDAPGARREGVLWRIDADVAGVGTAACGPGVYERDQVLCTERSWEMCLDVLVD